MFGCARNWQCFETMVITKRFYYIIKRLNLSLFQHLMFVLTLHLQNFSLPNTFSMRACVSIKMIAVHCQHFVLIFYIYIDILNAFSVSLVRYSRPPSIKSWVCLFTWFQWHSVWHSLIGNFCKWNVQFCTKTARNTQNNNNNKNTNSNRIRYRENSSGSRGNRRGMKETKYFLLLFRHIQNKIIPGWSC